MMKLYLNVVDTFTEQTCPKLTLSSKITKV